MEARLYSQPAAKDGRMIDGVDPNEVIAMAIIQLCDCIAALGERMDALAQTTTQVRVTEMPVVTTVEQKK